jgi:hypothetical protein
MAEPVTPRRLHLNVLTKAQRQILQACAEPAKKWEAYLAGGTAIAIQLGHRRSEDFDWFTRKTLLPGELLEDVKTLGKEVAVDQNDEGTFWARVDGVKFSAFRYRYPLLAVTIVAEGCELASLADIAAMKLLAMTQRATKRDYVDIHALVTSGALSLGSMLDSFRAKFPTGDSEAVVRALGYFGDVDKGPMPEMLNKTTWQMVTRDLGRALERLGAPAKGRRSKPDLDR